MVAKAPTRLQKADVMKILSGVMDPEIPAISVVDLGIIRDVQIDEKATRVIITPTYSGCPATKVIEQEIRSALEAAGVLNLILETALSPAWTTEWISPEGRTRLREYGIAPPISAPRGTLPVIQPSVPCPYCNSNDTALKSEFSGTPCKALYTCAGCHQPFEYFKCL